MRVSKKEGIRLQIDSCNFGFNASLLLESVHHGLQHVRLPYPSLSPEVCSNSCPLSWWWHPIISFSVSPLLLLSSICPRIRVFSSESGLHIRWPKYWGLQLQHQSFQWIFRGLVWSPCCPKISQESSSAPQFISINSLVLSLLYGPTLTYIHDNWKIHSFGNTDLYWQSDVSVF